MSVTSTNYSGTSNTFITPDVVAREALMILEKSLVAPSVMNSSAAAEWSGSKVGDTVRVRRPTFFGVDEYDASSAAAIKIQDAVETSVDLKIEKNFDVSFEISSKELTLSVDDFNIRCRINLIGDVSDIFIFKASDNVGNRVRLPNVCEKLISQTFAFRRTFYQTSDVHEFH